MNARLKAIRNYFKEKRSAGAISKMRAPGPAQIEHAHNTIIALELKKQGKSMQDIARHLGVSVVRASNMIKEGLVSLQEVMIHEADSWRAIELERLEEMHAGIWDRATGGDIEAIREVTNLMRRRAKLLGFDAQPDAPSTGGGAVVQVYMPDNGRGPSGPVVDAEVEEE